MLKRYIYNYNTKYPEGFIQSEIDELLTKFQGVNMDKFDKALEGSTIKVINNEVVQHPRDIYHALLCGLENRDLNSHEWD